MSSSWSVVFCRSLHKSKSKKAAQTSKMTAAWVDSITISDDDDDDDNDEAAAPADNQPNDSTHPAAESAPCDANQPSTVKSDDVPENTEAAKPLGTEESDLKTTDAEVHALEQANVMDTEPSVEIPMTAEKSSVEMLGSERVESECPTEEASIVPHSTAVLDDIDNLTTELMDTADVNTAGEVPARGSVDVSAESPSVDIPVIEGDQVLDSRSSEVMEGDKNGCSAVAEDKVFSSGSCSCYYFFN